MELLLGLLYLVWIAKVVHEALEQGSVLGHRVPLHHLADVLEVGVEAVDLLGVGDQLGAYILDDLVLDLLVGGIDGSLEDPDSFGGKLAEAAFDVLRYLEFLHEIQEVVLDALD